MSEQSRGGRKGGNGRGCNQFSSGDSNKVVKTVIAPASLSDAEVVARVRAGETALFEILMRRHNQRVYRVARSVLKDESETEDAMQQAYVNAFVHLAQFEERAQFSTWLTRITLHEALARRRRSNARAGIAMANGEEPGDPMETLAAPQPDPERQAYASELGHVLESAVDALPDVYRTVFMLREVEGLSTSETAAGLDLREEAVKTRLHRARAMLRRAITDQLGATASAAFPFHAVRCDRVVSAVLSEIRRRTTDSA
jgi:RNA polymerase sigma-70 factor, ECF subfamily